MHALRKLTKKEAFRKGIGPSVIPVLFLLLSIVFLLDIFPLLLNAPKYSFSVALFLLHMSFVVIFFVVSLFVNYKKSKKKFYYCEVHEKVVVPTSWKKIQRFEECKNAELKAMKIHVVS